jgi:disulfide oxidoreductase YuzD
MKCLPYNHKDLSLDPQHPLEKAYTEACICNSCVGTRVEKECANWTRKAVTSRSQFISKNKTLSQKLRQRVIEEEA